MRPAVIERKLPGTRGESRAALWESRDALWLWERLQPRNLSRLFAAEAAPTVRGPAPAGKRALTALLVATLLAAMPPALAAGHVDIPASATSFSSQPMPRRPLLELTPFVGGRLGGSFDSLDAEGNTVRIDVEDDSSFGLIVNFPSTPPTEWELVYSQQSTALDRRSASDRRPLDLDITYLHAGGLYLFDGDLARPYIAATLGATRFAPDDSEFQSETKFSFALGAGYKLFPSGRFGLRLDARVWGTVLESNDALFCRSGPEAAECRIRSSGTFLWQWEITAGGIVRF